MALVARNVRLTGKVQGVFYRAWARGEAGRLGVSGWIRNCPDGSVEAHLEGDEPAVGQMLDRMSRGPSAARVQEVTSRAVQPSCFTEFEVRH